MVRGGVGKFFAYLPVVLDLTHQQTGVLTLFPIVDRHRSATARVLRPDMITDSQGNPGVAR